MTVQTLDLVPRGVFQHEDGPAACHRRVLLGQGVEEHLERLAVSQVEWHGAERSVGRAHHAEHFVTDMLAEVG